MSLPGDHQQRLARARRSLDGLSVGDAFGERFFVSPAIARQLIAARAVPAGVWRYTDDTVMALAITETLAEHGRLDRASLARAFARKYRRDPGRGYGAMAHRILAAIAAGEHWRDVSPGVFGGTGSMGNGGAMRAGPIGAYFADEPTRAASNARRSAEVTHAHLEGQAGAVAVAVAAAGATSIDDGARTFFEAIVELTPAGETRRGIEKAASLPLAHGVQSAVSALGNGSRILAQDTVPFALWCAARHGRDFQEALWTTVSGLGDRDTTCAIVGSIVAARPDAVIPAAWLEAREPLSVMVG